MNGYFGQLARQTGLTIRAYRPAPATPVAPAGLEVDVVREQRRGSLPATPSVASAPEAHRPPPPETASVSDAPGQHTPGDRVPEGPAPPAAPPAPTRRPGPPEAVRRPDVPDLFPEKYALRETPTPPEPERPDPPAHARPDIISTHVPPVPEALPPSTAPPLPTTRIVREASEEDLSADALTRRLEAPPPALRADKQATLRDVRAWVAETPAPEETMASDVVSVRLASPTSDAPSPSDRLVTDTAPHALATEQRDLNLSIGMISLTVEAPEPAPSPQASIPFAAPASASRLRRHYLRL